LLTTHAPALPRVAIVTTEPPALDGASNDRRVGQARSQRTEVEAHLEAELRAAGFDVVLVHRANPAWPEQLEVAARQTESVAAITIVRRANEVAADVWITDRVTGNTLLRHVRADVSADHATHILALRAVELLHASLIELNVLREPSSKTEEAPSLRAPVVPAISRSPAPAAAPVIDRSPVPPSRDHATLLSVAMGASALGGPGGIPFAIAPALGLAWRPLSAWAGQIQLAGPAFSSVADERGSAELDQELGLFRVLFEPRRTGALRPFVTVGAGMYRIGAHGEATEPLAGRSAHALAAAFAAGAGARVALSGQVGLLVQGDALFILPRPRLRFARQTVAETALPAVLASLALEVSWSL
jgi:hypothetical protein